jgi:predicted permease
MAETFDDEFSAARSRGLAAAASLVVRALLRTPFLALEERVRAWARGGSWATDVRHATRAVARSPGFALITALTVGLGVGATVSLYSVVDAMLLRPLPVSEPDGLFRVHEDRDRYSSIGMEGPRIPFERYQALRRALTGSVFTGLAGQDDRSLSMRSDGPAFPVTGVLASGNYFDVLGIRPAVGRFFASDTEATIVLGHRLWQSRFGGSPEVVGRTVHMNGHAFTVIGVAPREFPSTVGFFHVDLWVPIAAHDGAAWPGAWVSTFGRLAPGIDASAAEQRAGAVARRLPPDDDPGAEVRGALLEPLTATPAETAEHLGRFLAMLFGTAVLVLLIAGANVAGMLIARAARRSREFAVRSALGIGRARLIRQSMFETVGLFTLGGMFGMGIAVVATGALARLRPPIAQPLLIDASPGLGALGFGLGIATLAGLLFGWMPALYASRSDVARTLRDGARGSSRGGSRVRGLFVTAQLAMSVVLLVTATLFVRTAHRGMTADPGFSAERVLIAKIDLSAHGYGTDEGRLFYRRLVERVGGLGEVESASLAGLAMLTGERSSFGSWRLHPDDQGVSAGQNVVDASYFDVMEIGLLAGRVIDERDVEGAPPAMVVNETFARRFWPDQNALGQTVLRGDIAYEVVGITRDGTYVDFGQAIQPFAFLSADQRYTPRRTLHVRYRADAEPGELVRAIRGEVAALDPDVAVQQAIPLTEAIGSLLFPQRIAATLIGVFGLLGLFLAATGVYGVLAHLVAQRTREFGIRLALGAEASGLLTMVLRRGARLTFIGTVVGLGIASGVTRFLGDLLHGTSPFDLVAFVGVPLLLGVMSLVASTVPARRVLELDPVQALRRE